MCHTLSVLAAGMLLMTSTAAAENQSARPATFELRDGDRVVLLGSTFFERENKYGYIETALTARYPGRKITFRNLGWDGDTVWAESRGIFDPPDVGYRRMLEQIAGIKPTVIFVAYGNNEAFGGPEGLPAFIQQYGRLLDDLAAASAEGVRFVLIAPLPQLRLGGSLPDPREYNHVLGRYVSALEELARERSLPLIKLDHLISFLQEAGDAAACAKWTDNGLTWKETAYRSFANAIAVELTGDGPHCGISMDADGKIHRLDHVTIEAAADPAGVRLKTTPRNLPLEGFGLSVFQLPAGTYELRVDGAVVDRAPAEAWRGRFVSNSPDVLQAEQLRRAVVEKNRLYFHHWRPQNVTYLFGFRKHEQGNNAVEVAEFEKLVAEKEREIGRLKQPVTRMYELVRVKKDDE